MRVAFVHPDLGIGGSERLIVDAALSLQMRGHKVHIFTSHHNPQHAFSETNTLLDVTCRGSFFPRHLFGYFHLLFAALKSIWLALWIYFCCPTDFDIIICDQISFSIPILKKCCQIVQNLSLIFVVNILLPLSR